MFKLQTSNFDFKLFAISTAMLITLGTDCEMSKLCGTESNQPREETTNIQLKSTRARVSVFDQHT